MLAQNFKSAVDLGLTDKQFEALRKTLVLLETGKMRHVPQGGSAGEDRTFAGQFNMNKWCARNDCGTIACIGGTAEMIGELARDELHAAQIHNRKLRDLFYPMDAYEWQNIQPSQAATALRSYLTTGDARWDLAVQT